MFDNFKKIGKKFVEARNEYTNRLVAFDKMMTTEYEKAVFSVYHDNQEEKNVYLNASDNTKDMKVDKIDELQKEDTVECLYEWIKAEGRDIAVIISTNPLLTS